MLKIRADQMEVFRQEILGRFKEELARDITKRFPEQAQKIGPDNLPTFVEESMTAASDLQLEGDNAIRFFVFIRAAFGPGFMTRKSTRWMADILSDEATSTETRLEDIIGGMEENPTYKDFLRAALA